MAKVGAEGLQRFEAYSKGAATSITAASLTHDHFSGSCAIDLPTLALIFRNPVPNPKHLEFAAVFMDHLVANITARFQHLTRRGMASHVLLAAPGREFDRRSFRSYPVADLIQKYPKLREKIVKGPDLPRFATLLTTVHTYGLCVYCGNYAQFYGAMPLKYVNPMNTIFDVSGDIDGVESHLKKMEAPTQYAPVLGVCTEPACRAGCLACGDPIPIVFNGAHLTSWQEDHMCPPCGAQQLFNIRPPKLNRMDNRKLKNLPIERR